MKRNTGNGRPAAMAVAMIVLASLVLAACGSSSSSTTAASTAPASSTAPGAQGAGGVGSRFAAVRECLKKDGIVLPSRKPGAHSGGPFSGGQAPALKLPAGVTLAQYQAALKKCGGFLPGGRGGFGAGGPGAGGFASRLTSPAFKAALAKFATCMRQSGINVPAPNTSGKGPVFDTKGIDTAGTQFRTAESKCSPLLRAGFRSRPEGAAPAPPAG